MCSDLVRRQANPHREPRSVRPIREADHHALWATLNDEEGDRLAGTHAAFTREGADRWYRSRGEHDDRLDLSNADVSHDTCIGEVVLNDLDTDNAACGFRIALVGPQVYGRGYGSKDAPHPGLCLQVDSAAPRGA